MSESAGETPAPPGLDGAMSVEAKDSGVVVTRHALDRFSTRHLEKWERGRLDAEEGLASFVQRLADSAWVDTENLLGLESVRVCDGGVVWTFQTTGSRPVLVTVV